MMRVLHVGKFYPPHHGGMERVVETLCRATRGIVDNRVLVARASGPTVEEQVDGIHVTRVATIGAVGAVHMAPAFASRLRHAEADLIVLHEPNPWALLSYAIARPAAPLAIWYHSDVVRPALQYALFYAPLARTAYRRARRFVVSSPPLGAHAAPLAPYQSRVRVIPFGIDPAPWRGTDGTARGRRAVSLFCGTARRVQGGGRAAARARRRRARGPSSRVTGRSARRGNSSRGRLASSRASRSPATFQTKSFGA